MDGDSSTPDEPAGAPYGLHATRFASDARVDGMAVNPLFHVFGLVCGVLVSWAIVDDASVRVLTSSAIAAFDVLLHEVDAAVNGARDLYAGTL